MNFLSWQKIYESTAKELYDSTVKAYPKTTKRQYLVDMVDMVDLKYTPFEGMKSLFVKGVAHSLESNKDYDTVVLVKNVNFEPVANVVKITERNGRIVAFERFDESNEILVRCNCQDFFWRWNYANHLDKSLHGKVKRKYEAKFYPGNVNPENLPGMCKHLIKCYKTILQTIA